MEDREPRDLREKVESLAADVEDLKKDQPSRLTRAGTLVGIAAGIAGLLFGGSALLLDYWERVKDPTVEMVMPPEVQLVDVDRSAGPDAIRVYVQPAFVSTGRSQRPEVLRDLRLCVRRDEQEGHTMFDVEALGHLTNDPQGPGLIFEVESGPAPLTVTPDEVQDSVLAFEPDDQTESPYFEEARYSMTLVAKSAVANKQLEGAITVGGVEPDRIRREGEDQDEESNNRFVPYRVEVNEPRGGCSPA